MNGQVRLLFDTRDEAVAYAQRHGIAFELLAPKEARRIVKAYADNFAYTPQRAVDPLGPPAPPVAQPDRARAF